MDSDVKKTLKTIAAVPATAGILVAMAVAPAIIGAIRGGHISSDHLAVHKAAEGAFEKLWEWVNS